MATILPFHIENREKSPKDHHAQPFCGGATIIIFPGVRYERMRDCDVKILPDTAGRSRRARNLER